MKLRKEGVVLTIIQQRLYFTYYNDLIEIELCIIFMSKIESVNRSTKVC